MFRIRAQCLGPLGQKVRRGAILLALLAVGSQTGCSREFYREWANQDVSEAVFEKSRDPRWRIDLFSIEPPALSRFADPYDPEFPPAPPDDPATEALSPVPQWPDNRLIVPAEGTGYIDMLEEWKRENETRRKLNHMERQFDEDEPGRRPGPRHRPAVEATAFTRSRNPPDDTGTRRLKEKQANSGTDRSVRRPFSWQMRAPGIPKSTIPPPRAASSFPKGGKPRARGRGRRREANLPAGGSAPHGRVAASTSDGKRPASRRRRTCPKT